MNLDPMPPLINRRTKYLDVCGLLFYDTPPKPPEFFAQVELLRCATRQVWDVISLDLKQCVFGENKAIYIGTIELQYFHVL